MTYDPNTGVIAGYWGDYRNPQGYSGWSSWSYFTLPYGLTTSDIAVCNIACSSRRHDSNSANISYQSYWQYNGSTQVAIWAQNNDTVSGGYFSWPYIIVLSPSAIYKNH